MRNDQSTFSRLASGEKLRGFFTPDVAVQLDLVQHGQHSFTGRDELMSLVQAARTQLKQAKVEILDVVVQLSEDRQGATASMTVVAEINNEKYAISQELQMHLKKVDDTWVISQVTTVKTLR